MPHDLNQPARDTLRDDCDDRPPNFLCLLVSLLAGAALWYGIIKVLGWILGAL